MFRTAGKAEIIRSQHKDEYYLTYLRNLTADVIHNILGARTWIKWRKEVEILTDLGYFLLTTFSGFQTIGEEYVNIIQVGLSKRQVPSSLRRCLMVLCHVTVPYIMYKLFDWLEKKLSSPNLQEVPMETREFLLKCIPVLKTAVLYGHRLHMAIFYLHGVFYHIAKRAFGVHYIQYSTGMPKQHEALSTSFMILGWLTAIQLIGSGLITSYRYLKDKTQQLSFSLSAENKRSSEFVTADRKCSLCLEERKHSSLTPCGHLFCWQCIHNWCCSKAECPLCREKFEPHRIVYLQNFDPPCVG